MIFAAAVLAGAAAAAGAAKENAGVEHPPDTVVVYPAPQEEELSADFELTVNSRRVPVYACRVSAAPINQVWPGYQRPIDQSELASFASWDMAGPVSVAIVAREPVRTVAVRPSSLGLRPAVAGQTIRFDLDRPRQLVVELNGTHHALHLFANPPEKDPPRPGDAGVRYFGPGVHRPGKIVLRSNETLYLAGGAVVYGGVLADGAKGLTIRGRGIIDVAPFARGEIGGAIRLTGCTDVKIEGLVLRDPDVWCCATFGCRQVAISNLKLVGLWRYNSDGIDICNSQNVTIRDCFVRSFDDSIVLKGLKQGRRQSFDDRPVRNVRVRGCVLWNDWGRAIEIGAETCAPEIADAVFEDCDIVRTTHIAMDIQHGDRAMVRDMRFQDIRVEIDDWNPRPVFQRQRDEKYVAAPRDGYCPLLLVIEIRKNSYSQDADRGNVRNIVFKDIVVTGKPFPGSYFHGWDAAHTIEGVVIENLRVNGRGMANAREAHLSLGQNVRNVRFAP
jgi:hypothetical protein